MMQNGIANSEDPDQTAPDLGLHCLHRPICLRNGERTKTHWDKNPLGQKPTGQKPIGQNPTAIFGREDKNPLLHKKG